MRVSIGAGVPLAIVLLLAALPLEAAGLAKLRLPVVCIDGASCSIQNLFDHDPGDGFLDYSCGRLGYDGHDGIDIRIPNLAVMQRGVEVVAAAPGRVRAIRDEMPDVSVRDIGRETVRDKEAGNAVVLRHGPEWETQYSHLLLGSVRVRPGDWVEAGDVVGLIGLSGNTEFPHVHFEVRYRGDPVDPFVGLNRESECGVGVEPLWDQQTLDFFPYRPTGLLQAGFSTTVLGSRSIESGETLRGKLPSESDALVFWVEIFGAHKGDVESISVFGPDGSVIADNRKEITASKARLFTYAGRKRRGEHWAPGVYRAVYRLVRGEADAARPVIDAELTIEVE